MPGEPLRVEEVAFQYDEAAWRLRPTSFRAAPGDVLAIIGPNGSGKSTLLRLAAGILPPATGRVLLDGADLAGLDRRDVAKSLGYLPQNVHYAFDYTVEEVASMGRFPHLTGLGFLSAFDRDVIDSSLSRTEMTEFRERPLSRLSGGERQRAFLASVLAQEPRVLLLDEPTTALDIHHQARFFRLLNELAASGIAVVVVTHDLNLASLYCTRLFLMSRGAKHCEGTAEEVLRHEVLSEVYDESVTIIRDERTGRPIVLPGLLGISTTSEGEGGAA
jgi:iron complex transport system ATP-binding protein